MSKAAQRPPSQRLRAFLRTTFVGLPWWKRKLLQLSVLLIVVGGASKVFAQFTDHRGEWSLSALTAGFGCFAGFLLGAGLRLFLKVGVLLAGLAAAAVWGLSSMGWIDVPWHSLAEVTGAFSGWVEHQFTGVHQFLAGYLPGSAMTGMGLASGFTTKPKIDLNPFDDD